MSRGTWQGSGTWQTSGPDLGDIGLVVALAAVMGVVVEVILSVIVWIAIGLGVVTALTVAGLIWWLRGKPAREARFAAAIAAQRQARAVTATATPQVSQETPPAIVNHYHQDIHIHGSTPEQVAAAIRAIPGSAITERTEP